MRVGVPQTSARLPLLCYPCKGAASVDILNVGPQISFGESVLGGGSRSHGMWSELCLAGAHTPTPHLRPRLKSAAFISVPFSRLPGSRLLQGEGEGCLRW